MGVGEVVGTGMGIVLLPWHNVGMLLARTVRNQRMGEGASLEGKGSQNIGPQMAQPTTGLSL